MSLFAEPHFKGTTHPYPDDTFYSVGRVPRKLLMKYLGVKMYLVRLRSVPTVKQREEWVQCRDNQVNTGHCGKVPLICC